MKWYDIRFWKLVIITLVVGLALVSVLGCGTPRAVTTQTFITDKQSERNSIPSSLPDCLMPSSNGNISKSEKQKKLPKIAAM